MLRPKLRALTDKPKPKPANRASFAAHAASARKASSAPAALARHAMSLGYAPIVIHGAVQVGVYGNDDNPSERARGIEAACAIAKAVGRAGGEFWLLRLPGGGVSSGCDREARAFETARFGALRWFEMESDLTIREI